MVNRLDAASLALRSLPKSRIRRPTGRKAGLTASEEADALSISANGFPARGLGTLVQCLQHYVDANPGRFTIVVRDSGRGTIRTFVLRRQARHR
jgi:hypothetical protein